MDRRSTRRAEGAQILAQILTMVAGILMVSNAARAADLPLDLSDTTTRAAIVVWSGTNGECVAPDCRFAASVRFEAGEAVIDVPNAYFAYASMFDVTWERRVKQVQGTPVDLSWATGSTELRIDPTTGSAPLGSYAYSGLWDPWIEGQGTDVYFRNEPASTENGYTGDWYDVSWQAPYFPFDFDLLPYDPSHTAAGRDWAYCENRHTGMLQNPGLEQMIWDLYPGRYCNLDGVRYDGGTGFLRVAGIMHLYQVDAYGEEVQSAQWELYEPLEGSMSIFTAGGMLLFEGPEVAAPSVPALAPPALGLLALLMLAGARTFSPWRRRISS
jgi:hypothetical protein